VEFQLVAPGCSRYNESGSLAIGTRKQEMPVWSISDSVKQSQGALKNLKPENVESKNRVVHPQRRLICEYLEHQRHGLRSQQAISLQIFLHQRQNCGHTFFTYVDIDGDSEIRGYVATVCSACARCSREWSLERLPSMSVKKSGLISEYGTRTQSCITEQGWLP
jgi:hypothetical protein